MRTRIGPLVALGVWIWLGGWSLAQPWNILPERMHRGPDPVAQIELAAPGDPTFESVAGHYPMLRYPREALGVLESAREFVVTAGGEVVLNNYPPNKVGGGEAYSWPARENGATIYFVLGPAATKVRYAQGNPPDAKRLADGYLPIVSVPYSFQGVEFRQTLFAWSEGMDPDGRLWAHVGLEMKNPTDAAIQLEVAQEALCGIKPRKVALGAWKFDLAPGDTRRLCLRIPRDGCLPDAEITEESPEFEKRARSARLPFCGGFEGVEPVEPTDFDRRLGEAAATWRQRLARAATVRVPESRVNDAHRVWLAYVFTNIDKEGELYFPHDGSGFYELVWGIAAIQACRALDMWGYPDEAGKCLDSIRTLVRPDGELKTAFGLSDSGTLLVALEDHYRYTQDRAWLERAADTIERMANWAIARRAKEKEGQTSGSPNYGMIKYQPSGDYPEPDFSFLSDTALCVGLEAAARSLRVVGRADQSQRVAAEAAAYRQDIEAALRRSMFERDGQRLLPILPASRAWLARANYGATGYYSLFASLILDTEFLAADDPHAALLTSALEQRGGLCAGVCTFFDYIDHGFTYGYWLEMLKRNEPRKAILGLYGSLAYGMSRTTYSGVECTRIESGNNVLTLPHLRSGAHQLKLLRMMLVREDGERLVLAQAAPRHWLKPGQRVDVQGAPTMFGPVSYTVESAAEGGQITVALSPPVRNPPREIQVFVRHPEGQPIRRVLANGQPLDTFDADSVRVRDARQPLTLRLEY